MMIGTQLGRTAETWTGTMCRSSRCIWGVEEKSYGNPFGRGSPRASEYPSPATAESICLPDR